MDQLKDTSLGWMALLVILWVIGATIYFIPSIVAKWVYHRQTLAIFVLNLFLGWTYVGWVAALVWAVMRERETGDNSGTGAI